MERQEIGVGIVGLGVVAGQVSRVLREKVDMLSEEAGCRLVVRRVKVVESDLGREEAHKLSSSVLTTSEDEFFNTPGLDIVVEATPGENPALSYLKRAIGMGKHIVTSNKEVIAKHAPELLVLAKQHNVGLHCEGAVGGGIPLIGPFQYDLVANDIHGIYAIINGTTNYILSRMAREGIDFKEALAQAQQLGYAETNPSNDIEGTDAVYKIAILASLAFQCEVRPESIYREGISRLSSRDFAYASELGFAIKLLAIAKSDDGAIEVRVHPVFVPKDFLLAKVDGVYNAVLVEGDLVGQVLFQGQGAGALPTSSAVVADVVAAAQDIRLGVGNRVRWRTDARKVFRPMADITARYYFRLTVADAPGVLAHIAKALGDHGISIASVIQKEADMVRQIAEVVIMSHPAREKAVQDAVKELQQLSSVREINNFIRVGI